MTPILPSEGPPQSLCLLRLSALGDVINMVPVVRTLQRHWPDTRLTWVIGKTEFALLGDLPDVEFVVYDKHAGWSGARAGRRQLAGRRFDVLLLMQWALRAGLLSTAIRADRRVGFDRERSREAHGLFVNQRIEQPAGRHVVDSYFAFLDAIGLHERVWDWSVPIPESEHAAAEQALANTGPVLLISPCSSHALRNWRAEHYAAFADYAAAQYGYSIVLSGGPTSIERRLGDDIAAHMRQPALDLIGKTSIKGLLALLVRAELLLTPDSGPMHMAMATGTDVIGLFAASECERAGPYNSRQWCVDKFDQAARQWRGKPGQALRWGHKIELEGVMDLIEVDDVIERFEAWREQRQAASVPT